MKEIFSNVSLNKLHLHYGLIRFAENTTTIFGLIVLYQFGYALWQVFLIWGVTFLARSILRCAVPFFLKKYGIKNTVAIGATTYIALLPVFYLTLSNIIPLWLYLLFFAFTNVFYWYPFHILYGLIGDTEKRGRQSAIREAYARIAQVLSPLLAGIILKFFGSVGLFVLGTIIFIAALYFLLQVKESVSSNMTLDWKPAIKNTSKRGFYMSTLFSFWEMFFDYAWAFVIFFLFHENTASMGGLIAFAIFARIIIDYFVGSAIDFKHSFQWYGIGALVISSAIIGRVFLGFSLLPILLFDVLFMLGYSLFTPYESVLLYNSLKEDKYPEWFALVMETGWDFGSVIASFLLAFFIYHGYELRNLVLIGIIALPFTVLLYRSYFAFKK